MKILRQIIALGVMLLFVGPSASYADTGQELIQAVKNRDIAKATELLTQRADVNIKDDRGVTVLMSASAQGDIEIVKILLANGADVNVKGYDGDYSALVAASESDHSEIVELLKKAGAKE